MPSNTKNIAQRALVVQASQRGYTQVQIAARLGITRQRVSAILKESRDNPAFLAERKPPRQQAREWLESRPDGSWTYQELYDHVDVGRNVDPGTKREAITRILRQLGYSPRWLRNESLGKPLEPLPYEPDIMPAFTEKPRKRFRPIPLEVICICEPKESVEERAEITALDYLGAAIADGRVPLQRFEPEPELPELDDEIGF